MQTYHDMYLMNKKYFGISLKKKTEKKIKKIKNKDR